MNSDRLQLYLDYRLPIDPRRINTMPDLDVAYSIVSGLVGYDDLGGVTAALAKSWKIDSQNSSVTFTLAESALWSDGTRITAEDVVNSFRDAEVEIGKDVPSVFSSYDEVAAESDFSVRFHLTHKLPPEKFIERLCEPMYAVTRKSRGLLDLSVTSGAYTLSRSDDHELEFGINKHWYGKRPDMFPRVVVRKPLRALNALTLVDDSWPMVVKVPNFILKSESEKIPKSFSVWRRHLDGLFSLRYAGRPTVAQFKMLIQYLKGVGDFDQLSQAIDHAVVAKQIYPKGTILFTEAEIQTLTMSEAEFKASWPYDRVKVLYMPTRFPKEALDSVERSICNKLPIKCEFVETTIQDIGRQRKIGAADLVLAGVGVDTINLDGALSYYFETEPNLIPSDDSIKGNFKKRMKEIRISPDVDQVAAYRDLMKDVMATNSILPLFHSSTTFLGRESIDFSKAPTTAETVPFQYMLKK